MQAGQDEAAVLRAISDATEDDAMSMLAALVTEGAPLWLQALAVTAHDHKGASFDLYVQAMKTLIKTVQAQYEHVNDAIARTGATAQLAALRHVIYWQSDYTAYDRAPLVGSLGDDHIHSTHTQTHKVQGDIIPLHVQKIMASGHDDLYRLIDAGVGRAHWIGFLYIAAARALGWDVSLLDFPQRAFLRIACDKDILIFDPVDRCRVLEAHDLRAALKEVEGAGAELMAHHSAVLSDADAVVRVFNPMKLQAVAMADYARALGIATRLIALHPQEYRLKLDAGVLCARLEKNAEAATYLQGYIDHAPSAYDRHEAQLLLDQL